MGSNHIFFSQIVLHVGKKLDKRFYLLVYCQEVLTANNNTCGVFRELKSLTREVYVSLLFLDVALGRCIWALHSCLLCHSKVLNKCLLQKSHIFADGLRSNHPPFLPLLQTSFILGFFLVLANPFSSLFKTSQLPTISYLSKPNTTDDYQVKVLVFALHLCLCNILRPACIKIHSNEDKETHIQS